MTTHMTQSHTRDAIIVQRRRLFEEGCNTQSPSISQLRFTYKWRFFPMVQMFKRTYDQEKIVFFTSFTSGNISHDCSKFINNNIANYVSSEELGVRIIPLGSHILTCHFQWSYGALQSPLK
jgi:hypothetical protein